MQLIFGVSIDALFRGMIFNAFIWGVIFNAFFHDFWHVKLSRFGAICYTALLIWPIWPNFEVNGLDWQCCLDGCSKMAPRILIFLIVLGAEYLSYVKSIETHARAFLPLNISGISSVQYVLGIIQQIR